MHTPQTQALHGFQCKNGCNRCKLTNYNAAVLHFLEFNNTIKACISERNVIEHVLVGIISIGLTFTGGFFLSCLRPFQICIL
ncbi:hypothetical protein FKM82_014355 [Ascaphus truei]